MLKNYFKIAFRNLLKHKSVSFINIFGLATGLACGLLILLFVLDELSYDRYHRDTDRIYRVVKDFVNDDGSRLPDATSPAALGPALEREIPEVAHATRVCPSWGNKYLIQYGDKKFLEDKLIQVDSTFFDVFTVPFVKGDARSSFRGENVALLTESAARKYFGREDPLGKIIRADRLGDLMVTGILKDVPEHSHFHFDFLVSIRKTLKTDDNWGWYNFYTYMKLKPHTRVASTIPKIQALYKRNEKEGKNIFYTQPLADIHLDSHLKWEIEPNSDRLYVYIFSIIALFVIAIACINYVNLATAKSALRAREIGVRKVSGAYRSSLIRQFLIESVITVILAFLLAVLLARLFLPFVNQLAQKQLSLLTLLQPYYLLIIGAFVLITGLAAGLYPALYLSSFKPVLVLKGLSFSEKGAFSLRKALVVFQFAIAITLTAGTFIVLQQLSYMRHARLGLDKEQVLIVEEAGGLSRSNRESLLNELSKINGVKRAACANGVVGGMNSTTNARLKGSENNLLLNFIGISYDYLNVIGITLKEGRGFSTAFPADTFNFSEDRGKVDRLAGSIVINEQAAKDLGIPGSATGKLLRWASSADTTWYLRVIGVAKDFHFASFKSEIKPFGFVIDHNWQTNFTIKTAAADLPGTIARIEKKWKEYAPERPFKYSFLDETFAGLYQSEQRLNKVVLYITVLAVIIACMGLFGLTAFMVERRTKEIGVRKIIGASTLNILTLLSLDFVKLVSIAIVIGSPLAWFFMSRWLENFAYRTAISWWIFILAGAIALLIALLTVSYHALKAALMNPIKSLRSE